MSEQVKKTSTKLSPKLRKFQKLVLKHPEISPSKLIHRVGKYKNKNSARASACMMLKQIGLTISDLLERQGIDDEHDVEFLKKKLKAQNVVGVAVQVKGSDKLGKSDDVDLEEKEYIKVDDNKTQLKAFELCQKLKGRLRNTESDGDAHTHYTIVYGHRNASKTAKSTGDSSLRSRHLGEPARPESNPE